MDRLYTELGTVLDVPRLKDGSSPSDCFRRNVFLSFQEDMEAIRQRGVIGLDTITFGSDYPPLEGTFPNTLEILDEILRECTPVELSRFAKLHAHATWVRWVGIRFHCRSGRRDDRCMVELGGIVRHAQLHVGLVRDHHRLPADPVLANGLLQSQDDHPGTVFPCSAKRR
jgi:hypothetical protein